MRLDVDVVARLGEAPSCVLWIDEVVSTDGNYLHGAWLHAWFVSQIGVVVFS